MTSVLSLRSQATKSLFIIRCCTHINNSAGYISTMMALILPRQLNNKAPFEMHKFRQKLIHYLTVMRKAQHLGIRLRRFYWSCYTSKWHDHTHMHH